MTACWTQKAWNEGHFQKALRAPENADATGDCKSQCWDEKSNLGGSSKMPKISITCIGSSSAPSEPSRSQSARLASSTHSCWRATELRSASGKRHLAFDSLEEFTRPDLASLTCLLHVVGRLHPVREIVAQPQLWQLQAHLLEDWLSVFRAKNGNPARWCRVINIPTTTSKTQTPSWPQISPWFYFALAWRVTIFMD